MAALRLPLMPGTLNGLFSAASSSISPDPLSAPQQPLSCDPPSTLDFPMNLPPARPARGPALPQPASSRHGCIASDLATLQPLARVGSSSTSSMVIENPKSCNAVFSRTDNQIDFTCGNNRTGVTRNSPEGQIDRSSVCC
jgi:hypothetical protein